jgi:hypothetical protein
MLDWKQLPIHIEDMLLWGAITKHWQYVISYDALYSSWHASAKVYPNASRQIDLGEHKEKNAAIQACETHYGTHSR